VTIKRDEATGDTMTDNEMQPTVKDDPEQAEPEQVRQQAQQSQAQQSQAQQNQAQQNQANTAARPTQRAAPGRPPLFRR
jgi:transcription initiation factor TFIID subunit TAF12